MTKYFRDVTLTGGDTQTREYDIVLLLDSFCSCDDTYTKAIINKIKELDTEVGGRVHFYVPHVGKERQNLDRIVAKGLSDAQQKDVRKVPALFITRKTLKDFDPKRHEFALVPLHRLLDKDEKDNHQALVMFFRKVYDAIENNDNLVQHAELYFNKVLAKDPIGREINLFGINIDWKKLTSWFTNIFGGPRR